MNKKKSNTAINLPKTASYKKSSIVIKNAHQHNLKNIDIEIEHNSFTVVTGVSGSGKSSLVFDTLFAEGQRRYVESLSSYARQFMGRMKKPDVDYILGLCPAVAIEQKVNTRNPRSTVATSTEIYDYLKLLFSRAGRTFSPISGREVKRHTIQDIVEFTQKLESGTSVLLLSPFGQSKITQEDLQLFFQKGFSRVWLDNEIIKIETLIESKKKVQKTAYLVVDRIVVDKNDEELASRIADSAETAFWEGKGTCLVAWNSNITEFNNRFELDGLTFEVPNKDFLSFNNPYGACKSCEGFGSILGVDPDLVIPNKNLSVYEGAIAPWRGDVMEQWKNDFLKLANKAGFPIHKPIAELNKKETELLWKGNKTVPGINDFFGYLEERSYQIQYRILAARYRGKTLCPDCNGTRLRKDAAYIKMVAINSQKNVPEKISMQEILLMTVEEAHLYFSLVEFNPYDEKITHRIKKEIQSRLLFLKNVGLGYLSLNRLSNTLSGGESQRINLATSLGSSLTGSMYVLDEPSIGLHSRDTELLISVLKALQKAGNTVIVVEHDEDVMRASEKLIDIGPFAGTLGGQLIFNDNFSQLQNAQKSLTAEFLLGKSKIEIPAKKLSPSYFIEIIGAQSNNLKNINARFPLEAFTVVSGVSGSGKTTLVKNILYSALSKSLGQFVNTKTGSFSELKFPTSMIDAIELIDQNPIGKSSRSNPVTYVKAYDEIRDLFASQSLSKLNNFKPSHFSFNVEGGRCDNCSGEGETIIEMQFMADIKLPCEVCNGKRFKKEILDVTIEDKNIFDILNLTVDEAIDFFAQRKNILEKLKPLQDVGLGYIKLGQGSNTLSGGEAQRVKLAFFLGKSNPHKNGKTVFIFDEPTTGLHFYDIDKLLKAFYALISNGNTVIVIEHNLDVIKCADWLIDLGPEGGDLGGNLVYEGTPEELAKLNQGYTAKYLKEKLLLK